jgi:hypothetical protein
MNFIELLFGISPDGGSGATELGWLVTAVLALSFILGAIRTACRRANF